MLRLTAAFLAFSLPLASPSQAPDAQGALTIPAGTTLALVNTRPVWAKSARPGDPLYLETVAPSVAGSGTVVPAGSYVLASLEDVLKPTRKINRALLTVRLSQLILPGGTTLAFPGDTLARITIQVSTANDLLLDNGTQMQINTSSPMTLPAATLTRSLTFATAPSLVLFHTATLCRFIPGVAGSPGSPGTPDTVIKGLPPTPDTVIPSADGGPPTVIPGNPGTQDVTIPGTPATPDTPDAPPVYCPDPPLVLASAAETSATPLVFDPPAAKPARKSKQKKS